MKDEPKKKKPAEKKPSLRQRMRDAFGTVSKRELMGVLKDTAKDLRQPKEIALLAGSSVVPGGWIGYGTYRFTKYRLKKSAEAANDDAPKDKPAADLPPVKPAKKGKPPTP